MALESSPASYDYVIVGSGAAGSVLAERLSRDPTVSVLLLEAGGSDRSPIHLVPKGFHFTMSDRYGKTFRTQPYGNGQVGEWYRGRVVGGSTTINGLMWNRGWSPEYDAWEQAGNAGWNWQRFLEAFKALEDHELGASEVREPGVRSRSVWPSRGTLSATRSWQRWLAMMSRRWTMSTPRAASEPGTSAATSSGARG